MISASEHPFKAQLTSLPKPGGGEFGKFYSLPSFNDPRIGNFFFPTTFYGDLFVFCFSFAANKFICVNCQLYHTDFAVNSQQFISSEFSLIVILSQTILILISITEKLPYSIRILLESAIRNCDNFQVKKEDVEKIIDWENTSPNQVEIPFKPARVLLQVHNGVEHTQ